MNLPKFLALLQDSALFFSRANFLGDRFEGSTSKANINYREAAKTLRHSHPAFSALKDLPDEVVQNIFDQQQKGNEIRVPTLMVNCWHMNEHESAAMWKLYSNGEPIVAIQTTYEKLDTALPSWANIGEVQYIDYAEDFIPEGNIFYPIMRKRKSFEHEREVRAVVWESISPQLCENYVRSNMTDFGINMRVEINNLIDQIYIDPNSSGWFETVVTNICKKYDLNKTIHKSSLSDKPLY